MTQDEAFEIGKETYQGQQYSQIYFARLHLMRTLLYSLVPHWKPNFPGTLHPFFSQNHLLFLLSPTQGSIMLCAVWFFIALRLQLIACLFLYRKVCTVLGLEEGKECVIVGTLYKHMKLKPCILDEYSKEVLSVLLYYYLRLHCMCTCKYYQ